MKKDIKLHMKTWKSLRNTYSQTNKLVCYLIEDSSQRELLRTISYLGGRATSLTPPQCQFRDCQIQLDLQAWFGVFGRCIVDIE